MSRELPFNYTASVAVDNIRRNNLGESTLCSHPSISTCSSNHGPLQEVCTTGNSFHIGSAPALISSSNATNNNDGPAATAAAATASIMWNYNPYRRRQSQDAAIHRNSNKSMPTREPLDSDILPVSITNCSYSDNTMSRQQVVVPEDDFRRQVRELRTDSIHIAHP
jgi:hypothetical protein